jgi:GNAT superfamily N-acetyltransferase
MLRVRPAIGADFETITGFIDEASWWLASKGTDQWARPWPDELERDDRVRRGIKEGCTWMVVDEGESVATISCRRDGNPELWRDCERAEAAVYVSRLIVRRSRGGQRIGNELINWAGLWARRQYAARWIRIDVWTTNTMLHHYYRKRGFRFCRRCDYVSYPSAMLFQKPTAGITSADVPRLREVPVLQRPAGQRTTM